MNKPMKIKISYFIEQHKFKIYFVLSFLIISLLVYVTYLFKDISINISSSVMGVLGAIVGGILTLCGSIYVHNNQLKSKSAIHRRNVIYKPLYDELIGIRIIVQEENPYPSYITFSKGTQTLTPHPQFSAWGRIKNDSRFILTPQYLADSLEELYKSVGEYLIWVRKASTDIQEKINEILLKKHNTTCTIRNLGDVIYSDIILKNKPSGELFKNTFENALNPGKKLTEQELLELEELVYEECGKLNSVQSLIKSYNRWIEIQDDIIEILKDLIKLISMKYEKLNENY